MPPLPVGFRFFDRSRWERCRSAFRFAFAAIDSFDGGVEEFDLFIDSRRPNPASRNS